MENVSLGMVYQHILHIEKRLNRLEDILQIPEVQLSGQELTKYKAALQRMLKGKEGFSWEEYKRSRSHPKGAGL